MGRYKIIIGITTFCYALFIFSYPPSFYNDDALFLSRGIDNFSVIDFSPHFPGYPFIILCGKFINLFISDSVYSLFILTSLCAIFLPLILFFYIKELQDEKTALIVFLLSLSSPYLNNLSLSLLSDSVGLFFLFLGLYFLQINKYKTSGIVLSIAFFSRPSYLVFYIVGLLYISFFKRVAIKELLISFGLTSLFFISYLFLTNGMLYLYEAERFIFGHFTVWGTGQNTQVSWFNNIFSFANIPFLLLFYALFNFDKKFLFLYVLFFSYVIWILFAQNPDNIRHMIPAVFLAIIFISSILKEKYFIVFVLIVFNLYISFSYKQKLAPADQFIKYITENNRIIITNRSIEILSEKVQNKVVDHYYINSANYLKQNHKVYILSTEKDIGENYIEFKGRFIGEHSLNLKNN